MAKPNYSSWNNKDLIKEVEALNGENKKWNEKK